MSTIASSSSRRWWRIATLVVVACGVSVWSGPLHAGGTNSPISASVASLFIGEDKLVEGTVSAAERDGNVLRLRLGPAPKDLSVALVRTWFSALPAEPETYFLGRTVRVAGTIQSFRGAPEIVVRDAADVQIVAAPGPAAAAVAPALTASAGVAASLVDGRAAASSPAAMRAAGDTTLREMALREQVDVLEARLRKLEERVRRLEHPGSGRCRQ